MINISSHDESRCFKLLFDRPVVIREVPVVGFRTGGHEANEIKLNRIFFMKPLFFTLKRTLGGVRLNLYGEFRKRQRGLE